MKMVIIIYKDMLVKQAGRNELWVKGTRLMVDTTRRTKAESFFRVGPQQDVPEWVQIDDYHKGNILYVSEDHFVALGPLRIRDCEDLQKGECIFLYNVANRCYFDGQTWKRISHDKREIKSIPERNRNRA